MSRSSILPPDSPFLNFRVSSSSFTPDFNLPRIPLEAFFSSAGSFGSAGGSGFFSSAGLPSRAASSASYSFKKSCNKYVLPYLILNSSAFLLILFSKGIMTKLTSSLVYFNFSKVSISSTNSLFIVCKNSFWLPYFLFISAISS